ncbi:MAG: PilZ domain-containing protein [Planctomycetota bacterium]
MFDANRERKWQTRLAGPYRSAPQVRGGKLECSLGQVTDLSVAGMRIYRLGGRLLPCGELIEVVLGDDILHLTATVCVEWAERSGRRGYYYGLRFVLLSPQAREVLPGIVKRYRLGGDIQRRLDPRA